MDSMWIALVCLGSVCVGKYVANYTMSGLCRMPKHVDNISALQPYIIQMRIGLIFMIL